MTGPQDEVARATAALAATRKALEDDSTERDEWRGDRVKFEAMVRRAIKVGGWVLALSLFGIAGNTLSNVQQSRAAGELKRQAAVQESSRESSREILRTLLAYADPESDVAKAGAAKTAEFVAQLVGQFAAEVQKGTSATAAVGWCRAVEVGNDGYVACLAQFGIALPPVIAPQ